MECSFLRSAKKERFALLFKISMLRRVPGWALDARQRSRFALLLCSRSCSEECGSRPAIKK
jgi:hypothetical protein